MPTQEAVMIDRDLRLDILHELEFEPSVNAENIGVAVEDGVVTLTGHVGNYAERVIAEQVVSRIKGVRAIAQEIQVRLPGNRKTDDDQIARRALKIIAWDTTIPGDRVQVKVENGWVTLGGDVEWQYQKLAAEQAVRKLSGVAGVTNAIEVYPSAHTADIKHLIEDSLRRSAQVDADRIRVKVAGHRVILEGKVHGWHEKQIAQQAAWSARGVTDVVDDIVID
jgi:osmotically-inducible protein OsmY